MTSSLRESLSRAFGVRIAALERAGEVALGRARTLGVELPEYLKRLELDLDEQSRLAEATTNGWTWFHRDLEALERGLLDAWSRRDGATLRVWVAGCSTGEEVFSLLMLAERHGLPTHVLGTDIDAQRVAAARAARYDVHALRHVPEADRARFFERDGDRFAPCARLRARARFEVHNLLRPPPRDAEGPWDLVCCRNVLIHATAEMAPRMLAHLESAGRHEESLVLGAADELAIARRPSRAPAPMAPAPAAPTRVLERWISIGNAHLRRHELDQALEAYARASGPGPGQDERLLMVGLAHRKRGDSGAAEHAIRRAVALDPDLWMGWMLLAGLYERQGREAPARTALESALRGLERAPERSWRVPADGIDEREMDATHAARLCRVRLRALERREDER